MKFIKGVNKIGLIVIGSILSVVTVSVTMALGIKSLGTTEMTTYAVSCSSTTATQVLWASTSSTRQRKGFSIYNNSNYTVYVASHAATAASHISNLYPVPSKTAFNDNIEAFNGNVYVLGTTADCDVRVIEKAGSDY